MKATTTALLFLSALISTTVATPVLPLYPRYDLVQRASTNSTAPAPGAGKTVTIKKGDTLATIAAAAGVGICDIAKANNIADPNVILAGATLMIPAPTGTKDDTSSPPPSNAPGFCAPTLPYSTPTHSHPHADIQAQRNGIKAAALKCGTADPTPAYTHETGQSSTHPSSASTVASVAAAFKSRRPTKMAEMVTRARLRAPMHYTKPEAMVWSSTGMAKRAVIVGRRRARGRW
ncbi:hypothetical protein OPT61_g3327 [Boeremia exigua]|uniref:Uncharacterized protein n=1 Tax=Boeremia exigua TaxID=749465 RepID=A0ACC2II66_9PLEO|nr:hypothetical protein OPT61_g3327 [Boeremia exigua]